MTTVALRPRANANALCKLDGETIDFRRVEAHLARLFNKHASNLAAYKTLQEDGKEHPLEVVESNFNNKSDNTLAAKGDAIAAEDERGNRVRVLFRVMAKTLLARTVETFGRSKEAKHEHPHARKGNVGTVPLKDEAHQLWHGPITIGGQTIEVDFDTGSSDIIVNKSAYTPGATSKKTGKRFSVNFGDVESAKGKVYLDTLEIGGVKAEGVAIGLADKDYIDAQEGDQGVAGMAFASLTQLEQPSFFDVLTRTGVLAKPMFTFALRDSHSTLTLGGIPDGLSANPTFIDIDASQGYWATDVKINGISMKAIHDTGSTLIALPIAPAKALFAKLGLETYTENDSLYAILESTETKPPKVTVQVGDFSRTLADDTLIFGKTDDGKPVLSIVGHDLGLHAAVLGDPWFRNVAAVFSRQEERPQIGFVGL